MKPRYRLNTDGSISIIAMSAEYAAQLRRQRRAYLSPVRTKVTVAMHPEQIKAEMRMKGVTPAMLCDELEVSAPSISQVITGRARSTRIQTRISEIIGKPISKIWSVVPSQHRSRVQAEEGIAA
ncbi:transcriptional regulator [Diaphorobacter sp. HDW4A]|uniref:helix-turn-helix domain-containing protein n=1 Tax=Diaphorobacter sp. HDW4A TaxID=2714924 RepID=UPI00140BAC2A|nr:helix-turn-helix domain-containing protein [Diaphorobacter sp. HDW4A]QIL81829.1 transcriptional regulator [Diaphorobacter sp. HDW4A]